LLPDTDVEAANLVEAACLLSSALSSTDRAAVTFNLNLLQTAAELLSAADTSATMTCMSMDDHETGPYRVGAALEAAHSLALCQVAARLTSILARTHAAAGDRYQATDTQTTPMFKVSRMCIVTQVTLSAPRKA
jgi:hypothetical protein